MLSIKPSVVTEMGTTAVDLVEATTIRLSDDCEIVKRTAKRLLLELKKKYEDFLPSILWKMSSEFKHKANSILEFPEIELDTESEPKSEESESESEEAKNEGDSFGAVEPERDEVIVKEAEVQDVLQSITINKDEPEKVTRQSMDLEEVSEDIEQMNMQGIGATEELVPQKMAESFAEPQAESEGEEEEEESEAESEEEESESVQEPTSAGLELPTQPTFN